jgi:hypothetical protein
MVMIQENKVMTVVIFSNFILLLLINSDLAALIFFISLVEILRKIYVFIEIFPYHKGQNAAFDSLK